jgi:hypothetical protein
LTSNESLLKIPADEKQVVHGKCGQVHGTKNIDVCSVSGDIYRYKNDILSQNKCV